MARGRLGFDGNRVATRRVSRGSDGQGWVPLAPGAWLEVDHRGIVGDSSVVLLVWDNADMGVARVDLAPVQTAGLIKALTDALKVIEV